MPVTTRSQSKLMRLSLSDYKPIYKVEFDFDEASEIWKANKRRIGEGCYRYVCVKKGKHNNECIAKCLPGLDYCRTHYKMFLDGKI